MSIQTTIQMIEKIESVKIHFRGQPMDLAGFANYRDAYESLKNNLRPDEWHMYSIVVTKSVEKTYEFTEV